MERRTRGGRGSGSSSSNQDGWNVRENMQWLWGGSQYSGLLCMLAASLCHSLMGLLVSLFSGEWGSEGENL